MKLIVLVPCYGGLDRGCDDALRALESRGVAVLREDRYAAIDLARSQLATNALARGFDEIMWIDGDVVFDPADVDRLRAHGELLVAGAYAKKGKRELAMDALPATASIAFGPGGGLVEVRYVGTGFMLTRRALYERMRMELPVCNQQFGEAVVPYFMPGVVDHEGQPRYLGEDYAFCERARRLGVRVLVDTRVRLLHAGRYLYGWEDAGGSLPRHESYELRFNRAAS